MREQLKMLVQHKYVHRTISSAIMSQTGKTPYDLGIDESEILERVWEQMEELLELLELEKKGS
jgi:hypothetical protein